MIAFLTQIYQAAPVGAHAFAFSPFTVNEFSVFQSKVNAFSCAPSPKPCQLLRVFILAIIFSLSCVIKFSSQLMDMQ